MEDAGFIIASYVLTLGSIAVYAWRVIVRGRRATAQVPEEAKPWT